MIDDVTAQPVPATANVKYWRDLVERVVLTYVETFIGLLIVDSANWTVVGDVLSTGRSAGVAALPAALSLVKSLLAKLVSNPTSASLAPGV